MVGWTRRGSAAVCVLSLYGCAELFGADFAGYEPHRDASVAQGGTDGAQGSGGASAGEGGTAGAQGSGGASAGEGGTAGAQGSGGSGAQDSGSPPMDAGDAAGGAPPRWVLTGAFVGGTIAGEAHGHRLRARIVWHGRVQGAAGGYFVDGWLE